MGGSVSFTTAQYLRLFDGVHSANFYANPANDGLANSILAVAPVVDFGFLSPDAYGFLTPPDPSATITVQGSVLSVPPGQSISLVGGNIRSRLAHSRTARSKPPAFCAPGGQLNLVSVASPGEVFVPSFHTGPNIDGASVTTMGTVTIKEGAMLDVSGQLDVDGNSHWQWEQRDRVCAWRSVGHGMLRRSRPTTGGRWMAQIRPSIFRFHITSTLTNGSAIYTFTFGPGSGGEVQLTADTLTMENARRS